MTDSVVATKALVMHPNDVKGFAVDISNWLEAGETATDVGSATIVDCETGADASAIITISDLAVATASIIDDEGNTIPAYHALTFTATGSGDGAGRDYYVTTPFMTSLSETENPVLPIQIRDGLE